MKSSARVVVISGGVVGVSTLYHLAKLGWSDVVLVERKELTSGSTWHADGLLPLFNLSYAVGQLHKYSVGFYPTLEAETGLNVGFSQVSNIRLARTADRMDECHNDAGVAETFGVETNFLTPAQVKEIWPLATGRDGRGDRRNPASRGRLYSDGRSDPNIGARGGDLPQHRGHRSGAAARRRMAGDHRLGHDYLRACGFCQWQLCPANRRDGRTGYSSDPGRASVHRD